MCVEELNPDSPATLSALFEVHVARTVQRGEQVEVLPAVQRLSELLADALLEAAIPGQDRG